MSQLLPRFAVRLLVPALALTLLAALGEPIRVHAQEHAAVGAGQIVVEIANDENHDFAVVLQQEAQAMRLEAEAARKAARQTAAQMRWFLTLPTASSKRCSPANCAS